MKNKKPIIKQVFWALFLPLWAILMFNPGSTPLSGSVELNFDPEVPYTFPDYYTYDQIHCMALNIYYEAGNQDTAGKEAVASVTMNRVYDTRWPDYPCDVITEKNYGVCQFSWYCLPHQWHPDFVDNKGEYVKVEQEMFDESFEIAIKALRGDLVDNTGGATHYYNHNKVNPRWAVYYPVTAILEDHTFMIRKTSNPL